MTAEIARARRDLDRANDKLRALVREALAADDVNVSAVAAAAGVGRQTIYRWAAEGSDVEQTYDIDAALARGLVVLASALAGTAPGAEVAKRQGASRESQALGVKIGVKALHSVELSEDDRADVSLAQAAAGKLEESPSARRFRY